MRHDGPPKPEGWKRFEKFCSRLERGILSSGEAAREAGQFSSVLTRRWMALLLPENKANGLNNAIAGGKLFSCHNPR
jgi:hypothetical protein